jgi:hypothetical protein
VAKTIWLLLRLALTIVTVIVCACVAKPGGGSASFLAAAIDVMAVESANAEQAPEHSHLWQDGASRTELAIMDAETDDDDDDDRLCDVADDVALSFRCIPAPRAPDCALRGELPIDASRFEAGTCLPRGPPA